MSEQPENFLGEDLRWNVQDDQFAVRITVNDINDLFLIDPKYKGEKIRREKNLRVKTPELRYTHRHIQVKKEVDLVKLTGNWLKRAFQGAMKTVSSSKLIIEPGMKALFVEEGNYFGDLPPGSYTLQTFLERLQFRWKKQATAILTRMEDQIIVIGEAPSDKEKEEVGVTGPLKIPTAENLSVSIKVRVSVQMSDVTAFLHNYMGANNEVKTERLRRDLTPLIRQALWRSVGKHSITELTGPDVQEHLSSAVRDTLVSSFQRYGLSFSEVQFVEISHEEYDKHRERKSKLWLSKEGAEVATQEQLLKLQQKEKNQELDALKINVKADGYEERAEASRRYNEARKLFMDEERTLAETLQEAEKQKLLRQDDMAALKQEIDNAGDDRKLARDQAIRLMTQKYQYEIEQSRLELDHAVQMQTMDQEIAIADREESRDNAQWKVELQKIKQGAESRLTEQRLKLQQVAEVKEHNRDQSWEELLHQQRMDRLNGEIEAETSEKKKRIELLEAELNVRIEEEKIASEKMRVDFEREQEEWALELGEKKSDLQLNRLERVKEMNAREEERALRLKSELEIVKEDKVHEREIARMQMLTNMGTEALLIAGNAENAAHLAGLKKAELSTEAEQLKAQLDAQKMLNEERQKLYDKLNESEKSSADRIADAYREAMQNTHRGPQVVYPPAGSGAPMVMPPVMPTAQPITPPPMPGGQEATWYVGSQSNSMAESQLKQQIQSGQVTAETLVWKAGMASWLPLAQVPELASSAPPPPMP